MPCRDDWPSDQECQACESLQVRLDRVTRLACTLLRNGADCPEEFKGWWKLHQKHDKIREKQEKEEKRKKALKRAVLKKLSKEEKELLGL